MTFCPGEAFKSTFDRRICYLMLNCLLEKCLNNQGKKGINANQNIINRCKYENSYKSNVYKAHCYDSVT